jgi:DNA polymerase III sliding clamp (beta) subunit (PCNA family)
VCDKEKNELAIISRSHDIGENVSKFAFENETGSKNITFLFHARFLQEYLNSVSQEIIIFRYNSEYTPVLFQTPEDKDQSLSLVMPIRK